MLRIALLAVLGGTLSRRAQRSRVRLFRRGAAAAAGRRAQRNGSGSAAASATQYPGQNRGRRLPARDRHPPGSRRSPCRRQPGGAPLPPAPSAAPAAGDARASAACRPSRRRRAAAGAGRAAGRHGHHRDADAKDRKYAGGVLRTSTRSPAGSFRSTRRSAKPCNSARCRSPRGCATRARRPKPPTRTPSSKSTK